MEQQIEMNEPTMAYRNMPTVDGSAKNAQGNKAKRIVRALVVSQILLVVLIAVGGALLAERIRTMQLELDNQQEQQTATHTTDVMYEEAIGCRWHD